MLKKVKGFTLIEILIVLAVVGLILTIVSISLSAKRAEIRDLERISSMNALRDAMMVVKNQTGSYENSYCSPTYVSLCAGQANSELLQILPNLAKMNDPEETRVSCATSREVCENQACNYTFLNINEDDFEVLFHLEHGADGYTEPGCYKVTPFGIQKK